MDLVIPAWRVNEETGLHTREMDFSIKITDIPFGKNVTRVHCVQTYKKTETSLELVRINHSLDIPYSSYFHLEEKWIISSVENSTTKCYFTYRSYYFSFNNI